MNKKTIVKKAVGKACGKGGPGDAIKGIIGKVGGTVGSMVAPKLGGVATAIGKKLQDSAPLLAPKAPTRVPTPIPVKPITGAPRTTTPTVPKTNPNIGMTKDPYAMPKNFKDLDAIPEPVGKMTPAQQDAWYLKNKGTIRQNMINYDKNNKK